jgi:hypothetical protein
VPNDHPDVVALATRLFALPADLVAEMATHVKVPDLRTGRVTLADVTTLEPYIARAEEAWRPREQHLHDAFAVAREHDVSRHALLKAVGVTAAGAIAGDTLVAFDYLVDAVQMQVLGERDGNLVVIDRDIVLAAHNGAGELLKNARLLCRQHGWRSPRSADQTLADPLLTAALAAV